MSKKIYQLRKKISLVLIKFALKISSSKICAILILLNIRKLKKFTKLSKTTKKILVFNKSGGNEDLTASFDNNEKDIVFYWIPRSLLKIIFLHFMKKRNDCFTKITNTAEIKKKKLCIEFLTNTFRYLNNIFNLDGFISFNIFYFPEKYFEEVSINLKKKFIVLHKESVLTPLEEKKLPAKFQKFNDKSEAYKISVYTKKMKEILIKSKIAKSNQIEVNGCPRSDNAFKVRTHYPKNNCIIFYLIETNRYKANKIQKLLKISNFIPKKINQEIINHLIKYAMKNKNIKIIFKGKTGVHKKNDFIKKVLPGNCYFIEGGVGDILLKDAKVVIGFNSTVVFEAIASNRKLIIPNFNKKNKIKEELKHMIHNKNYLVSSFKEFDQKLDFYLRSKYLNNPLTKKDKKTLKYYLGNIDGKSGQKMNKFLRMCFN